MKPIQVSPNSFATIANLAQEALYKEIYLTPKPGLVDQDNNGAHQDMDLNTFLKSIEAITPFLAQTLHFGFQHACMPLKPFFSQLRLIGQQAEKKMFQATNNINTHKGAIFAFVLLLSSIGRLQGNQLPVTVTSITTLVSEMCRGLVAKDLHQNNAQTAGERLFNQFQLTGARGEAESGYQLIRDKALPCYRQCLDLGYNETFSLLQTLLTLMANNPDTNIVHRGGLAGLDWVQSQAKQLLNNGGALNQAGIEKLIAFDEQMNQRRLSPGGSADLIAVTWFLAHFPD